MSVSSSSLSFWIKWKPVVPFEFRLKKPIFNKNNNQKNFKHMKRLIFAQKFDYYLSTGILFIQSIRSGLCKLLHLLHNILAFIVFTFRRHQIRLLNLGIQRVYFSFNQTRLD